MISDQVGHKLALSEELFCHDVCFLWYLLFRARLGLMSATHWPITLPKYNLLHYCTIYRPLDWIPRFVPISTTVDIYVLWETRHITLNIPVLFWYFEYVCACVCMGICICKCGCNYVYLYIDSICIWILHIMWTNQCLYKYIM